MWKVFEDFFSNLAESLLSKLTDPSSYYNLESTFLYYLNFALLELFHIKNTSEENVFKTMENSEISEATDIGKTPWKVSKRWR